MKSKQVTRVTPKKKTSRKPQALPDWPERFLALLRDWPNVTTAARLAGVSRCEVYRTRQEDAEFAQRFKEARVIGFDAVEDAGIELSRSNPTMMIFMLKNNKPGVYADRVEENHSGEITITVNYADTAPLAPGAADDQT